MNFYKVINIVFNYFMKIPISCPMCKNKFESDGCIKCDYYYHLNFHHTTLTLEQILLKENIYLYKDHIGKEIFIRIEYPRYMARFILPYKTGYLSNHDIKNATNYLNLL